ncbi:glutamate-cysteine ligase family protein [Amycolatopsis benzoatilytica]|uniref:glutamate-cysteine ligase family protein n=1 Tax=Amycolatopsis benzoatilytica TaxID=346045 RepID=UPI000363CAA0|nr:glutamate-cysteine ligase family protein [Amycolatopsis benzoatilytica]
MTAVHDFPDRSGSAANRTARVLADRAEGERYVASVCFKHGPPRLLGVELEFTVHHAGAPVRPLDPDVLAAALGPHTPRTLRPDSPAEPLPAGSPVSLEPGCQVELSPPPQASLRALHAVVEADLAYLSGLLARHGLELGGAGIDEHRPPHRVLRTPRYAAMERRFAPLGDGGLTMMCSTAGLQVCVDAGEAHEIAPRWAAAHAMGPPLLALFANSSVHAGANTGFASARWLAVLETEPVRTRSADPGPDPAGEWARRMMDTPLMVFPRGERPWDAPEGLTFADWIAGRGAAGMLRRPTVEDLDYHLTTMFTPVRPHGYLELRFLDGQPPGEWLPPVALVSALLARPSTVELVRRVCAPVAGKWAEAARTGLADRELAAVAEELVELGIAGLDTTGFPVAVVEELAASLRARLAAARGSSR